MRTLIFLLAILSLFVFLIALVIKIVRRESVRQTIKNMAFIVLAYFILWLSFYLKSTDIAVPMGTDVCFDDWCATITQIEKGPELQKQVQFFITDSTAIVLHVKMSNHARGIAQKPSEPRIRLIDTKGNYYAYSVQDEKALEKVLGKQIRLDQKLALHESLETKLVFAVPQNIKGLRVLIEEGPLITQLLFPQDRPIFLIH